jgi:hypothetical protein
LDVFVGWSKVLLFGNLAEQLLGRSEAAELNRTKNRFHKKSRFEKRLFIYSW